VPTALLLNSGGKDSLAAAILMSRAGWSLASLHVDAGQRNAGVAAPMAARIAQAHCVSHDTVLIRPSRSWVLEQHGRAFLAHQGAVLASIAAAHAAALGIDRVFSGIRKDSQHSTYPTAVQNLIEASRMTAHARFELPLWDYTNEQVYQIIKDDPLWKETVTCNTYPPCNSCPRCHMRAEWLAR
jgi:7-cyano-7-deazaguanine synthase in queuosine biosynthesis